MFQKTFFYLLGLLWAGGALASDGAVSRDQAEFEIQRLLRETTKHVETKDGNLKVIGHRGGSYKEFPHSLNHSFDGHPPKDIKDLMAFSFEKIGMDSIELDLRTRNDKSDERVFIVHDKIKPIERGAQEAAYLERNSLQKVLETFIERGYHLQGKSLILEIKTSYIWPFFPRLLKKKDRLLIRRTMKTISKVLTKYPDSRQVLEHISFSSLHSRALKKARETALNYQFDQFKYYYIATSNTRAFRLIYQVIGLKPINFVTLRFLRKAEWLTGVWFQPAMTYRYGVVFNGINKKRKNKLEFIINTFRTKFSDYSRVLQQEADREVLENVVGIAIDVK